MAKEFLGPYATAKVLEGVLEALPLVRPNFLQTAFASGFDTRNTKTVNFDKEFAIRNVIAEFVHPKSDVSLIELGDFGHTEAAFAYSKEGWADDDFETLDQRQLGQAFGQVDIAANQALRLVKKATIAEQRFENLFENTWAQIAMFGSYVAAGEKHPTMKYDFGRSVSTKASDLSKDLLSSTNLTTTAVTTPWGSTALPVIPTSSGYTAGQKAWTKANIDAKTATPVQDIVKMYQTARRQGGGTKSIIMQTSAYTQFNYDVELNYKDAASTTISSILSAQRDILPQAKEVDGLTLVRYWTFANGVSIPIYTYDAKYNNRDTGVEVLYIPDGWVINVPDPSFGLKLYGRIQHRKAQFQAMPRFINRWVDDKSGDEEFEVHTSFLIGHKKIDSVIALKVN